MRRAGAIKFDLERSSQVSSYIFAFLFNKKPGGDVLP